jgi:hypothetical protein
MRTFWYAALGYTTAEIRDQVLADFTTAAQPYVDAGTLAPATWDEAPNFPAGVQTVEAVDGLPGVAGGYNVPHGWDSTEDWAMLASILQDPAESGSQGLATIL